MKSETTPVSSAQTVNYKTTALVASSLAVIFMTLMSSGLNVALPSIGAEFKSDAILLGWVVTAFVLAAAVGCVPAGRIADIVGLKRGFFYGMILFTAASAVAIFASSTIMIIVCRSIQGIAAAMISVSAIAMVTAIYPLNERGRALGINIACVYAGSAVGPFLGGILTDNLGWRSIFVINIPVGIIVMALLLWKVKGEWRACKGEKFDYAGSLIFGFALIAAMYGFSILPDYKGGFVIFAGIVLLLIFLKWENRSKSPVLDLQIFRNNKNFVYSNLAALISYTSIFAISFLMSLYLQYIKGFSAEQTGWVLVVQPFFQTALSPLSGRLSDKIEPRIVASAGMACIFAGLTILSLISGDAPIPVIIGILALLGVGFALFSSPNSNAIMSSVTPRYLGVASAVMSTVRSIGQMLSMGITMIVMAVVIGRVAISPEFYPVFITSVRIAFGIFAALCAFGIYASLTRGKVL